jgi:hypothetical protein
LFADDAVGTHQNLSVSAGPVGKWARFSLIDAVNRPNSESPPNAGAGEAEGMVQPRKDAPMTRGSFFSLRAGPGGAADHHTQITAQHTEGARLLPYTPVSPFSSCCTKPSDRRMPKDPL